MTTTHTTTIHAICPRGGWDYYRVEYSPAEFMAAEDFQDACNAVRGTEAYQEVITETLAGYLMRGTLTITGNHGSLTEIVTTATIDSDEAVS